LIVDVLRPALDLGVRERLHDLLDGGLRLGIGDARLLLDEDGEVELVGTALGVEPCDTVNGPASSSFL
jgi:hypothetical protein